MLYPQGTSFLHRLVQLITPARAANLDNLNAAITTRQDIETALLQHEALLNALSQVVVSITAEKSQLFSTVGTFPFVMPSSGIVRATVIGSGGGGSYNPSMYGAGGGSGAVILDVPIYAAPLSAINVVIGAGGIANTNGNGGNGGVTSVNGLVAQGGQAGSVTASSGAGGLGGAMPNLPVIFALAGLQGQGGAGSRGGALSPLNALFPGFGKGGDAGSGANTTPGGGGLALLRWQG